ncbi:MAG: double-strand break repair protein AddB [Hyphomicrobium sp.]|jgi:ATP-dependent helicase/nuclease subunit B
MIASSRPNIFTIPAGRPFLDCLAEAILEGNLPALGGKAPRTLDLPGITLLLPTRRATRALQEAFLRVAGGRAMLLPKIIAVSEGEEDASLIASLARPDALGVAHAGIAPAMNKLEQRLALTNLVLRWSEALRRADDGGHEPQAAAGSSTPAQAAMLAAELASLMDMVETEDKTLDGLAHLVPETFSTHWQQTLTFLEIVTKWWPAELAEKGLLSAVGRRNAVIRGEAQRMQHEPPNGPVIVAGVTGSIPATVELMRAVAELPHGAIVLPALDTVLDEASWNAIIPADAGEPAHPEHPQFGLKKLLDGLRIARSAVAILGESGSKAISARGRLVAEVMRPARTTARWEAFAAAARAEGAAAAPQGLSLIEAPTAQDEAEAVALILREAISTPGRTAALVSPDRLLARRVAVRLEAWGIKVDDSAGRPFAKTPPGAFLDLLIEAVANNFAPAELMSLLKHPITRLGLDPFAARRAARALEIAAFRAPYLGAGLAGVEAALEKARQETLDKTRRHRAVVRLFDEDWDGARDLVQRLRTAVEPLTLLYDAATPEPLRRLAKAHADAAGAVARQPGEAADAEMGSLLWQGEAGETGASFFASLLNEELPSLLIPPSDYADLYRSLISGENVRPRGPVHPRLAIWGPFEARLQQPDVVILGSLNDGTWPQSADPGAWLNRPMRETLGLPSPEEKIGQAAHDFATLLSSPQVILTRAEKMDGVPTVPSRWLLRLKALLDGMGASAALTPREPWLGWARQRDNVTPVPRLAVPEPRPPLAMRPRKLSVSRIETWLANPYAIFAREILGLEPLDPLGQEPGASLRGSIIHSALSRFSTKYPKELPKDTERELVRLAREVLDEYAAHPRIAAFWVPRFERFAAWFAETEPSRRKGLAKIVAETSGRLQITTPGGVFELTARADRIDVVAGALVITDYKTGTPPKDDKVVSFIAPQLPLEAAIARSDIGFPDVPRLPVAALRYISASGGDPPGDERDVKCADIDALAASALDGLARHVAHFDMEETPYRPLRRARFFYDYDDYAHLARVAEWSSGATTNEEA